MWDGRRLTARQFCASRRRSTTLMDLESFQQTFSRMTESSDMADIIIQFHALPEELGPLLHWAMKDLGVHLTAFRFPPLQAVEVQADTLDALLVDPSIGEFRFTLGAPIRSVTPQNDFFDQNPGSLSLDIGRLSEKGLMESCLSCRTSDARSFEVWKKIARKLKGMTKAGAIDINLANGASGRSRNHRYTPGAKALDEKGVPIKQFPAATTVFHFE
jgi:hypothetical protein